MANFESFFGANPIPNTSNGQEDIFIDEEENNIDDFLFKTKNEMQNNLEVEVALFMSSTGIKHGMSNFYFRQLLTNFRSDFSLPSIENKMTECLENTHRETVAKIKSILNPINKITVLIKLLYLEVLRKHVLCISVCFERDHKLEILLLAVRQFDGQGKKQFDLTSLVEEVLIEYKLSDKKLLKTLVSGFEQIGCENENVKVTNPFHCTYYKLLPAFLDSILNDDGQFKLFKDEVMSIFHYFVRNAKATQLFKQECNVELDLNEMDFGELLKVLLKHKSLFLAIYSQVLNSNQVLSSEQWSYLEQICKLKNILWAHLNAIRNQKAIVTIDKIIPFLNNVLDLLDQDFKLLGTIPAKLKAKIAEYFDMFFNVNDDKHEQICLEASCLNPQIISKKLLNKYQVLMGKNLLKKSKNIEMGRNELSSFIDSYYQQIENDPETYKHMNPFDFWHHNTRYGKLSEYAIELLSIPIKATLPFDSSENQKKDVDDESFEFSINNSSTYIKMTQNLNDIERNSIIRINQALCYGSHNQGSFDDFEKEEENSKVNESMEQEANQSNDFHIVRQLMRAYREESVNPEFVNQLNRRRTENDDDQHGTKRKVSKEGTHDPRKAKNRSRSRSPVFKAPRSTSQYFKDFAAGGDISCDTPVLLVYGVNQYHFDCRRIYNLFCGYGDIIKLTFLVTKKNAFMIEMGDISQANNARKYLNNLKAFKCELRINPTDIEHVYISKKNPNAKLDNGKQLSLDCSRTINTIWTQSAKEDMAFPSKRTYFENVPAGYTVDQIKNFLTSFKSNAPQPNNIKLNASSSSNLVSGYMVFDSAPNAAEAIMIYNFMRIDNDHRFQIRFTQSAIF